GWMPSTSESLSPSSAPSADAIATAVVSEPPRPSVVTSRVSRETPWKPATRAILPSSSASLTRPGVMSMIRLLPWRVVVMIPACEPVKEYASIPNELTAMASTALEMRAPEGSRMSISRCGGDGQTWSARSRSSSVVSPIADATTTTSSPAFRVSTILSATRRIRSADSTEEPPYFCTTSATRSHPSGVDRLNAALLYWRCLLIIDDGNLGGHNPGPRLCPQSGVRHGHATPDSHPTGTRGRGRSRCVAEPILVGRPGHQPGRIPVPGPGSGVRLTHPGPDHGRALADLRAPAGRLVHGSTDHQDRTVLG